VFSVGEAGARLNPGKTFFLGTRLTSVPTWPARVAHRHQIQLKDIKDKIGAVADSPAYGLSGR
jgi:hypothetical protein